MVNFVKLDLEKIQFCGIRVHVRTCIYIYYVYAMFKQFLKPYNLVNFRMYVYKKH